MIVLISDAHRFDAVTFCRLNRALIGNPPNKRPAYVLGGTSAVSKASFHALQVATTRTIPSSAPWTHVFSHRGTADPESLEHTFAGYDLVKRQGSRYLELDVVNSKDGTLFISHDLSAKRIFGVDRNFADMSDAEIMKMRSKNGESPHTLEDVIACYGTSMRYVVELKEGMRNLAEVVRIIDEHPKATFVVQCFSSNPLEELESTHPSIEKLLLVKNSLALNHGLKLPYVDAIALSQNMFDETNVKRVHAAGKRVGVYTPDSDDSLIKAITLDADIICTNHTARALALERTYGGA